MSRTQDLQKGDVIKLVGDIWGMRNYSLEEVDQVTYTPVGYVAWLKSGGFVDDGEWTWVFHAPALKVLSPRVDYVASEPMAAHESVTVVAERIRSRVRRTLREWPAYKELAFQCDGSTLRAYWTDAAVAPDAGLFS